MQMKNDLSRITIDIPKESHRRLKALAALLGKSMREIVIESIDERIYKARSLSKKTRETIEDVEGKKDLVPADDIDDLLKKLGI